MKLVAYWLEVIELVIPDAARETRMVPARDFTERSSRSTIIGIARIWSRAPIKTKTMNAMIIGSFRA